MVLERERCAEAAPWMYAGTAYTPERAFPTRVLVTADGDVDVDVDVPSDPSDSEASIVPNDLGEKIRLIMRAQYKQAKLDGEAPAWRIVRWRAGTVVTRGRVV